MWEKGRIHDRWAHPPSSAELVRTEAWEARGYSWAFNLRGVGTGAGTSHPSSCAYSGHCTQQGCAET